MAKYAWNEILGNSLLAAGGGDPNEFINNRERQSLEADKLAYQEQKDERLQANSDRTYELQKENSKARFELIKQKAEQWKAQQQASLYNQGWQDVSKFQGGNPQDFQAMNVPGVGQMFRPLPAEDKAKQLIAQAKVQGLKAMSPEQQQQYALMGGQKESAYSKPTWKQQQVISSVRASLASGKHSYKNSLLGGRTETTDIKTVDDAMGLISSFQLDPELFKKELSKYQSPQASQSGTTPQQSASDIDSLYNNF